MKVPCIDKELIPDPPTRNERDRKGIDTRKQIVATGVMSNLVGMYCAAVEGRKVRAWFRVIGKADEKYFILEGFGEYSCKLATTDEMKDWVFFRTKGDYEFAMADYARHDDFRLGYEFMKKPL